MDRLFLDANVLFSAAYRSHAGLLALWRLKDVVLCSSRYAIEEARINLDEEFQRASLNRLSEDLTLLDAPGSHLPRGIILPEKDIPILLSAIGIQATHLLTGDLRHFGSYLGKTIAGVTILLPAVYLKERKRSSRT
jgi:uncharacterized protein